MQPRGGSNRKQEKHMSNNSHIYPPTPTVLLSSLPAPRRKLAVARGARVLRPRRLVLVRRPLRPNGRGRALGRSRRRRRRRRCRRRHGHRPLSLGGAPLGNVLLGQPRRLGRILSRRLGHCRGHLHRSRCGQVKLPRWHPRGGDRASRGQARHPGWHRCRVRRLHRHRLRPHGRQRRSPTPRRKVAVPRGARVLRPRRLVLVRGSRRPTCRGRARLHRRRR